MSLYHGMRWGLFGLSLALCACFSSDSSPGEEGRAFSPSPAEPGSTHTPFTPSPEPLSSPSPSSATAFPAFEEGGAASAATPSSETETPEAPIAVSVSESTSVPLVAPETITRSRKRVNVDQLSASIVRVSGGIAWVDEKGEDLFTSLSETLGKPDYLTTTREDLEPNMIFEKFLGDAARDVCSALVDAELERVPSERTLMIVVEPGDDLESAPEAVEENIRLLLLEFHGRWMEAGSPELNPWLWLFESVDHLTGEPVTAWRAICVALMTHPDFYSN